jgi:hypothetical protein
MYFRVYLALLVHLESLGNQVLRYGMTSRPTVTDNNLYFTVDLFTAYLSYISTIDDFFR